tara:strand:+ start:444 stop:890 length:447 start_codon:yes stop_codon:yes gene_type:complete
MASPQLLNVDTSIDDRGELVYANKFNFLSKKIKRFYIIQNHQINFVRAWHGHKKENKYIQPINGSIKVVLVKIDNWIKPGKKLNLKKFVISSKKPGLLHIPGGYAHGIQTLSADTKYIVYSNFDLKQSLKDDYRFPSNYWGNWNIKFR